MSIEETMPEGEELPVEELKLDLRKNVLGQYTAVSLPAFVEPTTGNIIIMENAHFDSLKQVNEFVMTTNLTGDRLYLYSLSEIKTHKFSKFRLRYGLASRGTNSPLADL